jgi:hypothetical protein
VDLALLYDEPAEHPELANLGTEVAEQLQSPLAARLSVFWAAWQDLGGPTPRGRFPLADQLDLARSGVCLAGVDRRGSLRLPMGRALAENLRRETLEMLLSRQSSLLDARLRDPLGLVALGRRVVTKQVLFPARFLYTFEMGDIARNEEAVEHYAATRGETRSVLVRAAMEWRRTGWSDDEVVARLLGAHLADLYSELIAVALDHATRPESRSALLAWRARLLKEDDPCASS